MEYDLARARNVDAAPVEMYWTSRTRSFLPRHRLFPLRSLSRSYGSLRTGWYVVTLSIVRPSVPP
eukprot:scaffold44915_cov35-Attheya_sp.AAC.1